ncbi:S-layer homology domain-containing protein [Paenibacillus xylanexedens]|uniref:S-layer homology domain-containing protein n=1 Tax=Paenibacillus xylanexedens TaxID=528191 RepID=UPI0011A11E6E|nr:S-layer homology domain-containing protein [Paenibacillus xylanexedens]
MKRVAQGKKKRRFAYMMTFLTATMMVGTCLSFGMGSGQWTRVVSAAGTSDSAVSRFSDIKGHWAQATIAKAYGKNLISGYQDGTFRPNGKITRGEYAAILARATRIENAQGQEEGEVSFPDLQGHWSETAVRQLVGQGFIDAGDYASGFKPNTELTRYEMMKWIANGLIKSDSSFQNAFNDTKNTLLPTPEVNRGTIRDEQIPYLALVRGTGIVGGFQDGTLKPADTTTRAEVSAILLRYMDVEGTDASKYSDLNEMREVGTTGTNLTTISNYKYSSGSVMISDLSEADISLVNKSGVLQIHRFIVVDATQSKPEGIYAKLFMPEKYASGSYRTFVDISFKSNLESSDLITFNRGLSDSLIQFNRLNLDVAKKQGINTIPMDSGQLLKKGVQKRFWVTSTLRNTSWSYSLKTDQIGDFRIQR